MTDQIERYNKAHKTAGERRSEPNPPDLPTEAHQHFEQAYAYDAKKDFENALRECDLAIQLAPAWAEPHNLRGIVLDELGRKEDAIAAYREAVRLDPALREAQDNLAEAEAESRQEKSKIEPIVTRRGVQRPGWVVVAAIWLALFAVVGGLWPGVKRLGELSQIDWTANAVRLGVEAGALESVITFQAYLQLAVGVVMSVSVVGIWTMKKWGTVIYGVIIALLIFGQVWALSQGESDLIQLVFVVSFIAIGLGLMRLWRDGELT